MHLDEGDVQRLLHAELAPSAATPLRAHLATCDDCQSRIAAAELEEGRIFGLLRHLDHPPPAVSAATIMTAATSRRARAWTPIVARRRDLGRRAAAVLIALGIGGAAYAAPGSPLPALARRLLDAIGGVPQPEGLAPPSTPVPGSGGGITIAPGARLTIVFSMARIDGLAAVALTDGDEVAVRTLRGSAAFATDVDVLTVASDSAGSHFEVDIPRQARWVEVRVGERRLFLKDGTRIVTDARPDAGGRYVVMLPARP
jgi:hypothetical protein